MSGGYELCDEAANMLDKINSQRVEFLPGRQKKITTQWRDGTTTEGIVDMGTDEPGIVGLALVTTPVNSEPKKLTPEMLEFLRKIEGITIEAVYVGPVGGSDD